MLDVSGLRSAFAAAVSSEEVPRGKPAPDVYLEAAARLGVPPAACAAVEDSSNGLRSAAAAGLAVIAVPRPEYPPAADALDQARLVLDSLTELTDGHDRRPLTTMRSSGSSVHAARRGELTGGARTAMKSRVQPVRYWPAGRC